MVHKNRNERPIWLPRQYWRMLTCYRRTSMIHQESRRRPNRFRHLVYIRVPTDAYYRGGRPALYQQHGVEEIARSDAGAQNLGPTTDCIAEIIERSKVARRKSIWSRNSNARLALLDLPEKKAGRWSQGITPAITKRCHWVEPVLVAQVNFTEWTQDNQLRQPVFLGLRSNLD